jgi:hypothetical protein
MKKTVLCAALIVLACATALQARLMSPPSMAKKVLLEPHGAVGLSMMGGELPEGHDQVMGVGLGYSAGLSLGYAPINAGAVMLGVEYTGKPFVIHGDHPVLGKYTDTITINFVDIFFGWKGYVSYFYYEGGLFIGPKVGTWEYATVYKNRNADRIYGGIRDVDENNGDHDFGVYLGLGASLPVARFLRIDLGVNMQAAFVPAYEDSGADVSLTTVVLLFKVGFTFII